MKHKISIYKYYAALCVFQYSFPFSDCPTQAISYTYFMRYMICFGSFFKQESIMILLVIRVYRISGANKNTKLLQ
jgi:hypothetical protein